LPTIDPRDRRRTWNEASCASIFAAPAGHVVIADSNEQAAAVTARLSGGLVATIDVAEAPVEALIARRKGAPGQRVNRSGVLQHAPTRAHRTMKGWELVVWIDPRGTYVCCRVEGSAVRQHH
jgi:hypothetical protein